MSIRRKSAYSFVNDPRDEKKRVSTDASYDPSTLHIPQAQLESMKKMERQYWDIKRKNFDIVIFFKKGKFYELYDTDAELASREFGLRIVNDVRSTGMMMSGVPEQSFTMWSQRFITRGYKVGRVEQMVQQNAKPNDFMHRELVRVYSSATLNDTEFIQTSDAIYLVAVYENVSAADALLGVCAIDCSRSKGCFAHFEGPERYLQLKTFLYHTAPHEIIVPQYASISKTLNDIIYGYQSPVCFLRNMNVPEEISKSNAFSEVFNAGREERMSWAMAIAQQPSHVHIAFWLATEYLRKLHVLTETLNEHLSLEPFASDSKEHVQSNFMILDCHTLQHLNIVPSNATPSQHASGRSQHKTARSFFTRIDYTLTSAGKRLLKNWVLHPLRVAKEIQRRQDFVKELMNFNARRESVYQCLKKCKGKDIERNSWKLRALADEKSVMWVDPKQQGKKVHDTLRQVLTLALAYVSILHNVLLSEEMQSIEMAHHILKTIPGSLQKDIEAFEAEFLALPGGSENEFYGGFLMPSQENNPEYAKIETTISRLHASLECRLIAAQDHFGDKTVRYIDLGKDKFLIEVPLKKYRASVDFAEFNRTAGFVRLIEERSKKDVQELSRLESQKEYFLQNFLRKTILHRYIAIHTSILSLVQAIAALDALNALAVYSDAGDMCCPEIIPNDGHGLFEAKGLFHPETKVLSDSAASTIVRNDVSLNPKSSKTIILTGPNMGGKSTLMRSIANACIGAQIGCFVHATSCTLSPMDRIYTRIGAKDALFQGKSTFLVELSETAHILQRATNHSLVLVDELGRGTSTLDGYAIAWGSLLYLVDRNCFTVFSTHYYFLAIEAIMHFASDANKVCAMQMQFLEKAHQGKLSLLYKLIPGICSKSYGLDVARRAGIPDSVIARAKVNGRQLASLLGFDDKSMNGSILKILMEKLQ